MLIIQVDDSIGNNRGNDCVWNADLRPARKSEMMNVVVSNDEDNPTKFEVRIILSTEDPEELEQLAAILQGAARYGKMIDECALDERDGDPSLHRLMHPEEYDESGDRID